MREEVRSIVTVRDTSAGLAQTVWLDRLDRAVRDGLDDKMLGCVGSDQLTGIRTTRWSSEGEVSADGCREADGASNAVREQQRIWCSTKQLRRHVRWHEQEIRFSWAGGKRYVTELVVVSGRVDIRAVTKARTLESKATEGDAYVMEPAGSHSGSYCLGQVRLPVRDARSEGCPDTA